MITIVTDCTAYLSKEESKKMSVVVVPLKYKVNGQSFYETYRDEKIKYDNITHTDQKDMFTQHASISVFLSAFNYILRNDSKVICITLSSRMSGAYHNACIAAKGFSPDQVVVIDSLQCVGGLKLLIEETYKYGLQTDDLSVLADKVLETRDRIGISFSVETMEPLKQHGRLGHVRQSIGTPLNIRPVLQCEKGAIVSLGISRGLRDQVDKIMKNVPKSVRKIIVNYDPNAKNLEALKQYIDTNYHNIPIEYISYGAILLIHIGKGALVVNWLSE